jgi:hypothetical protein
MTSEAWTLMIIAAWTRSLPCNLLVDLAAV